MWHAPTDVSRRLEDTIRELCTRAVNARDFEEVTAICSELRSALNQYVNRLRVRAAGYSPPPERRSEANELSAMPNQNATKDEHEHKDDEE